MDGMSMVFPACSKDVRYSKYRALLIDQLVNRLICHSIKEVFKTWKTSYPFGGAPSALFLKLWSLDFDPLSLPHFPLPWFFLRLMYFFLTYPGCFLLFLLLLLLLLEINCEREAFEGMQAQLVETPVASEKQIKTSAAQAPKRSLKTCR